MLYELLYTSAANTLDGPGYGVVAKTQGIPAGVEKFLRELCHYEFVSLPGLTAEAANPAVYSHLIFDDAGEHWHVLSRIAFAGNDYSQRAVFFAHHVAIADSNCLVASPARLMQDPTFLSRGWNGELGLLAERGLPKRPEPLVSAPTWGKLTGDPDWAQAWISKWRSHPDRFWLVIVRRGADVLALFAEALSCIPDAEAWNVTFSTYVSSSRGTARIDWGGLLEDTTVAAQLSSKFPDSALDLTKQLGSAPRPSVTHKDDRSPASNSIQVDSAEPHSNVPEHAGAQASWEELAMEEARFPKPKARPKKPTSRPPAPPPPPAAPRFVSARWIFAAVLTACLAIGGVAISRFAPNAQNGLVKTEPPSIPSTAGGESSPLNSDRNPQTPVARPTTQDRTGPSEQPQTTKSEVLPAEKAGPILFRTEYINEKSLSQSLKNSDAKRPVALLTSLPAISKMHLRSHPKFPLEQEQLESEIRVRTGTDESQLVLKLQGPELQIYWSPKPPESSDLLGRLRLCMLELIHKAAGEPGSTTGTRVVFNPILPPVPVWPPQGVGRQWQTSGFGDLSPLMTVLQGLDARLRIDGVSLKGESPLDLRPRASSRPIAPDHPLRVNLPIYSQGPLPNQTVAIAIEAHLNRPATNPGLLARVVKNSAPGSRSCVLGPDNSLRSAIRAERPQPKSRTPKALPIKASEQPTPPNETSPNDLLADLLSRCGEVSGAILVTIDGQEVDILRFTGSASEPQQ